MINFFNLDIYSPSPPFYIQKLLLNLSLLCAVLSMSLWCFNCIPYEIPPLYSRVLIKPLIQLGMLSFVLSLAWLPTFKAHPFAICFFFYILIHPNHFEILWMGLLFYLIPRDLAKQIFIYAISAGFILNALHMSLEALANLGMTDIKEFLISINPYFRLEKISFGWWPPPYYEGRIRGLYAEPSHMVGGILPIFGFCWYFYKKNAQKLWLVPIIILPLLFLWAKTLSGLLGASIFFYCVLLFETYQKYNLKRSIQLFCISLIIGTMSLGLFTAYTTTGQKLKNTFVVSAEITEHVALKNAGHTPPPLDFANMPPVIPRLLARTVLFMVHFDLSLQHPFGISQKDRRQYWEALKEEEKNLPKSMRELSLHLRTEHVTQLSQYTIYATDLGFVLFMAFIGVMVYSIYRILRNYKDTGDIFNIAMCCVLCAYLGILTTQKVSNTYASSLFFGFFCAYAFMPTNTKARA